MGVGLHWWSKSCRLGENRQMESSISARDPVVDTTYILGVVRISISMLVRVYIRRWTFLTAGDYILHYPARPVTFLALIIVLGLVALLIDSLRSTHSIESARGTLCASCARVHTLQLTNNGRPGTEPRAHRMHI